MHSDEDFMGEALRQAQLALDHDDIPVGAVVVKDGKIIAAAHNEREKNKSPTAHAEIQALNLAAKNHGHWNLTGATLYVTLEPCPMCAGAIVMARVKEVVFAAKDAKGGSESLGISILSNPKLNHRSIIRQGPMAEESAQLLRDFFQSKRKKLTPKPT